MSKNAITTKHSLDFEVSEWELADIVMDVVKYTSMEPEPTFEKFRVGTVHGLFSNGYTDAIAILAITNDKPGNGHLIDAFEWFEFAAYRSNKNLVVMEIWNERFKRHLIEKRRFEEASSGNVFKKFRKA